MSNPSSVTALERNDSPELYQVRCTIQDGEYEYGDSFVLKSTSDSVKEKVYQKLLEVYAYGEEEGKEMVEALKTEGEAMIGCRVIKDVSILVVESVKIIVRGGVIQDIQNIPDDVNIRVFDYDVDGVSNEETGRDDTGDRCMISEWNNA
jgi:hypothetical protein